MSAVGTKVSRGLLACLSVVLVMVLIHAPATSETPAAGHHDYLLHKPNEIGRIPIFMYHNIVPEGTPRDSSVGEYMYRTYDEFWNDMLWLYEHDFYLTSMWDVVNGTIDIPAGKHPIVFTFDDGTSLHLTLQENDAGEWEPTPDCAVGMMERFHAEYPDFGRGAHFAMNPANGFSWPAMEQDDLVTEKIHWLAENGYEIGNHTALHPDLNTVTAADFQYNVGDPIRWLDTLIGKDHPSNAMRILTLPFGIYPEAKSNPDANSLLMNGFSYEGVEYRIQAVLVLNGGSTWSSFSKDWDPMRITRVPVENSIFPLMEHGLSSGESAYYTSDGDPATIAVPWPLPEVLWHKLHKEKVKDHGMKLVRYNPETGKVYPPRTKD